MDESELEGEGGNAQFRGIRLADAFLARILEVQRKADPSTLSRENAFDVNRFRRSRVTFRFNIRSVESILYYLGEITRQYQDPEFGTPSRLAQVKTRLRYGVFPLEECDGSGEKQGRQVRLDRPHHLEHGSFTCEPIFVLTKDLTPDAFYTVNYDGVNYSIPPDPAIHGRSYQVLELVKQLLALHTSAKQLPQSSVISIIGGTAQ